LLFLVEIQLEGQVFLNLLLLFWRQLAKVVDELALFFFGDEVRIFGNEFRDSS